MPDAGEADRRLQAGRARVRQAAGRRHRRSGVHPPPAGAVGEAMAKRLTLSTTRRCCGPRAAPRSRCPRSRSCSTATARSYAQSTRDPEALRRLLRRPVAGRRRRSAAQRLRAQHGGRELRSQVRAGAAGAGAGRRQRRVRVCRSRRRTAARSRRRAARRLPRLVAEPAAVGHALAVRTRRRPGRRRIRSSPPRSPATRRSSRSSTASRPSGT